MIELETELDMGIAITRADLSERQFRMMLRLRRERQRVSETREKADRMRALTDKANKQFVKG